MTIEQDVAEARSVDERLDRLYAELAAVKRSVILARATNPEASAAATAVDKLRAAAENVSALWSGPGAVEEIRAQRGS